MRPVLRVEILPLDEYEKVRSTFRARVIDRKRRRRVALGEHVSALFENKDTVLLQIQEMLRTERITTESGVQHEIATYNEFIPAEGQLSVTLFVEIADKELRDRMLVELAGLEERVELEVDGVKFAATGKREGALEGRTTAVHYLKFDLSPGAAAALRAKRAKAALSISHPKYAIRAELSAETVEELAEDLS
jgi:hypothetical protein